MAMPTISTAFATPERPPVVQVVAPANLPEGYTFHASFNGIIFPVVVPAGGVHHDQRFTVPFATNDMSNEATPLFTDSVGGQPSIGNFRDGLLDCCSFGPFHVTFWNALVCPQILMAQVLTRMKLDWCGNEYSTWHLTFRRMLVMVIAFWVLSTMLQPPKSSSFVINGKREVVTPVDPFWRPILHNLVTMGFGVYTWIVLMKLRYFIRERYRIPNTTSIPGIFEDFCCAFWCGCCTVAQLARQTADYDQERALCCSETGLIPSASVPIVTV